MRDVPARWALAVGLAGNGVLAGAARADRYEASLHVHAIGGAAAVGDPAAEGATAGGAVWTPLVGAAVRASYTRSNRYQLDASVAGAATGDAAFARGAFTFDGEPVVAPFTRGSRIARADAGVTVRLGVAIVPVIRIAAGVQARRDDAPVVAIGGGRDDADGRGPRWSAAPIAAASAGLDLRLDEHVVIGAAVGGTVAVAGEAWRSIEATVHVAYYGYPLWID